MNEHKKKRGLIVYYLTGGSGKTRQTIIEQSPRLYDITQSTYNYIGDLT